VVQTLPSQGTTGYRHSEGNMDIIEHAPIEIQSPAGSPVAIGLKSMPGAGLKWEAPSVKAGCALIPTASAQPAAGASAGVGGPEEQSFVFTCSQAGRYELIFELKRPWERVTRARQKVTVEIQ
jgi:predicted secreted protein